MKKIPYGKQNIEQDDIDGVVEVLQSDFLTQGPAVPKFEKAFSNYVGAKYAVAVSNATAGLHIANMALGVQPGDRIITTPITFAATANCARYCGAEIWLADIDPDSFLIDINSVRSMIESKPKGFFKGIIPVDFAGLPVDLESFRDLSDEHDLWIIEDAAHAPGGFFVDTEGQKNFCGNGRFADCSVFSFHPVKHIACGEGGLVTTDDEEIYRKLLLYRSHGITKQNMSENRGGWYYEMQVLGFNYRLTDIQAALGYSQLSKNSKGVELRNLIALKYKEAFKATGIKYQCVPTDFYHAYHLFVIRVSNRRELYDYLKKSNIFTQIHYIPIHHLPYYKNIGYGDADLKVAESYYSECISLPMYPTLTKSDQDLVIEKILDFKI